MARITVRDLLSLPWDTVIDVVAGFIKSYADEHGAGRLIVGLSGGVDSAVVLKTVVEAAGAARALALILPDTRVTPAGDVEDAVRLAEDLGVEYIVIPIDRVVDSYSVIPGFTLSDKLPVGNLRARIRMTILYYYANKLNGLVVGAGDRSELLLGYFTKHGDGGVDIQPLACLYKTQVRELARRIGIPDAITSKPSSPRLWEGQLAEEELGLSYEAVDLVFYSLIDRGLSLEEAVEATGLPLTVFQRVLDLHRRSRHKRSIPPMPRLPWLPEPIREI
ncbi:MAG: NAD+ synthase [Desulfurococcus sp.]|nr:NAD+ synthase [Desulfurococcus sp.]